MSFCYLSNCGSGLIISSMNMNNQSLFMAGGGRGGGESRISDATT